MSVTSDNMSSVSRRRSTLTGPPPMSQRASIVGVMAARRLSRKLTSNFQHRMRTGSGISVSSNQPQYRHEPTFRMEPKRLFPTKSFKIVMERTLSTLMSGFLYTPSRASLMAQRIAEEIKLDAKSLQIDRYKIVVHVLVSVSRGATLQVTGRGVWDPAVDTYVTAHFENESAAASATVYAVYTE